MKKPFRRAFLVKNFYHYTGLFPVPGIEFNCYVNKQFTIIRVSEQFYRMALGPASAFALRKLKQLLFLDADKAKSGTPVNIFTDMLPDIDSWPTVTEGELQLWDAQKELAVHRSTNDLKHAMLYELYKMQRAEPDSMISLDGLSAKILTPCDRFIPEIPFLEKEGYISRKGTADLHKTDWVSITIKGFDFLEEQAQAGAPGLSEEVTDRLLGKDS